MFLLYEHTEIGTHISLCFPHLIAFTLPVACRWRVYLSTAGECNFVYLGLAQVQSKLQWCLKFCEAF